MGLQKNAIDVTQHVQEAPSAVWSIYHQRPGYPIVDVYILLNGKVQKILPAGIVYIDENTVEVRFTEPRTGFATVLV